MVQRHHQKHFCRALRAPNVEFGQTILEPFGPVTWPNHWLNEQYTPRPCNPCTLRNVGYGDTYQNQERLTWKWWCRASILFILSLLWHKHYWKKEEEGVQRAKVRSKFDKPKCSFSKTRFDELSVCCSLPITMSLLLNSFIRGYTKNFRMIINGAVQEGCQPFAAISCHLMLIWPPMGADRKQWVQSRRETQLRWSESELWMIILRLNGCLYWALWQGNFVGIIAGQQGLVLHVLNVSTIRDPTLTVITMGYMNINEGHYKVLQMAKVAK